MDGPSGTPPTPPYSVPAPGAHSPPQMAANPSTVAAGAASTARVLFVPPRANAGAAQKPAPPGAGSKRPAGAAAAGGQPATKKAPKKVSARRPGGQASSSAVADFLAPPTSSARAPPARATSTAAAAAGARQVLDDMATSVDNESFLEAMNVGSSFADDHNEQGEEEHQVHQMDEHGEGLIEPPKMTMGRAGNYTLDEDRLLCKTWLKIGMDPAVGTDQTRDTYWVRMKDYFDANNRSGYERTDRSLRSRWSLINADCQKWAAVQANIDVINPSGTNDVDRLTMGQSLFKEEGKRNKKGKLIPPRTFVFFHCYELLCNEEKWKSRDGVDALASNAAAEATINLDEEATSDDNKRSSTPHSAANSKRPLLGKKAAKEQRGKKAGDDDIAIAMDQLVSARREANEDKKAARMAVAQAEARRTALQERMAALEEKKVAMAEHQRLVEEERDLFFKDTSKMDERQKEYINLARDEVLAKKRALTNYLKGYGGMNAMGAPSAPTSAYGGINAMGGYGGMMGGFGGGMGGMGGFGGAMGPMPGIGGFGGGMGGMGGFGVYGGMGGMGGMTAPASEPIGMGAYGGMGGMTAPASEPVGMGGYGGMVAPGGFMASLVSQVPPSNAQEGVASMTHGTTTVQESNEEEDDEDDDIEDDGKKIDEQ